MKLHGMRMSGTNRYHARNSGVKHSSVYNRSSALSKYSRTKAKDYSTTGSRFNTVLI